MKFKHIFFTAITPTIIIYNLHIYDIYFNKRNYFDTSNFFEWIEYLKPGASVVALNVFYIGYIHNAMLK